MLFFDVTKTAAQRHHSGLTRTSRCLRSALGACKRGEVVDVIWHVRRAEFVDAARRRAVTFSPADWLITPELFSDEERPGFRAWLHSASCGTAAVYHDAIPLRFPEITWPQSVARHPHYMKMLAGFDVVLANSAASAAELRDYWQWLGVVHADPVPVPFGADGHGQPRASVTTDRAARRTVVMLGIVEPRKNQSALLNAAEELWAAKLDFDLAFAGRVNPHFGRPIVQRMRRLERAGFPLVYHESLDDAGVIGLLQRARFMAFPSLAEGCGLPVLEALWAGVPVVCSDLPALRETAAAGGCRLVPTGNTDAWRSVLRELLVEGAAVTHLATEACSRPLSVWADTAAAVWTALAGAGVTPSARRR